MRAQLLRQVSPSTSSMWSQILSCNAISCCHLHVHSLHCLEAVRKRKSQPVLMQSAALHDRRRFAAGRDEPHAHLRGVQKDVRPAGHVRQSPGAPASASSGSTHNGSLDTSDVDKLSEGVRKKLLYDKKGRLNFMPRGLFVPKRSTPLGASICSTAGHMRSAVSRNAASAASC